MLHTLIFVVDSAVVLLFGCKFNGFVKINNMGATLSEVAFEYKALWIQAGIYFLTTCWVYRWQILMSRKHAIERYKELKEKENLAKQMTD